MTPIIEFRKRIANVLMFSCKIRNFCNQTDVIQPLLSKTISEFQSCTFLAKRDLLSTSFTVVCLTFYNLSLTVLFEITHTANLFSISIRK